MLFLKVIKSLKLAFINLLSTLGNIVLYIDIPTVYLFSIISDLN